MLFIILSGLAIGLYGFSIAAASVTVDRTGFAFGGGILMALSWITFTVNHLIESD